jgi:TldD protein
MISDLPIDKIIETAMRHGADFAEVFTETRRAQVISCDDKKIENPATFFDFGVGIRVVADGRTAYGSTNDISKKNLLGLAKGIGKAAKSKSTDAKRITLTEKKTSTVATTLLSPVGIPLEKKCDMVIRANETAWGCGKEISQVHVIYKDSVRKISVATSDGVFASDEQVGTVLVVTAIARKGNILQTGMENTGGSVGFEAFDTTPPEEVAERAARRAIKMLSAREAPCGTMTVVISSDAGGTMIHEAIGHGLEADLALEGHSIYAGKLGKKVASELITVVDDATLSHMRGTFTFDDEGMEAKRTTLIERGVLITYMTDRLNSLRMNAPSTGNSRRQSYEYPPIVRMTNTLIMPGGDDPKSIISSTHSGLFVKKMGGGQVNTINGDFVFDVQEGYLIENGKIAEPVRGATLIGNGPKVLCAIDKVGSDLGFSIGTCSKEGQEAPVSCGQPTIRIPEIVVGGRAT